MNAKGTRRSTLEPSTFAAHLGHYLWNLVNAQGGDKSGRWLSARIERSHGYCAKVLNIEQAMTTNDIALVAELFGVSPFEFVRNARDWDGGSDLDVAPTAPFVPPVVDNLTPIGFALTEEGERTLGAATNMQEIDDPEDP